MHPLSLAFRALLLSSTAAANVIGNPPDNERANAIKEAFQFAWNGYFEHAFPNESCTPLEIPSATRATDGEPALLMP